MSQSQHFSDYGFDPQIDYFQFLEETQKNKRQKSRSIDTLHFKLQKPNTKEESTKNNNKNKRSWRKALQFWRWKWPHNERLDHDDGVDHDAHRRAVSELAPEPLSGTLTTPPKEEVEIPYVNLREVNLEQKQQQCHRIATSSVPIYFVT